MHPRLAGFTSLCLVLVASQDVTAFSPSKLLPRTVLPRDFTTHSQSQLCASVVPPENDAFYSKTFELAPDEVKPLYTFNKGGEKEKLVNAFGIWTLVVSFLTGPVWALVMTILNQMNKQFEDMDPNRVIYDRTGKIWSNVWLTLTNSYPSFSGEIKELKKGQGACLYVANHASWLDIPVICTVLDPVFKFISKAELKSVPCIGQQLDGVSFVQIFAFFARGD